MYDSSNYTIHLHQMRGPVWYGLKVHRDDEGIMLLADELKRDYKSESYDQSIGQRHPFDINKN